MRDRCRLPVAAGCGSVRLLKGGMEESFLVFGSDSDSSVDNLNADPSREAGVVRTVMEPAAVNECISDDVGKHLAKVPLISGEPPRAMRETSTHCDRVIPRGNRCLPGPRPAGGIPARSPEFDLEAGAVAAGVLGEVGEEIEQGAPALVDDPGEFLLPRGQRCLLEEVRGGENSVHGCPHLMAHGGEEERLHSIGRLRRLAGAPGFPQLSLVAEDGHATEVQDGNPRAVLLSSANRKWVRAPGVPSPWAMPPQVAQVTASIVACQRRSSRRQLQPRMCAMKLVV